MTNSRYDSEGWTHDEFLEKMDREGGLLEMLEWGGLGCFPPEIRQYAATIEECIMRMKSVLVNL